YKSSPLVGLPNTIQVSTTGPTIPLKIINAVQMVVPVSGLASLAANPNVIYVSPDRMVQGNLNNAAPAVLANYAWGLGLDGTHVGVAVIDSGIHAVDDLSQTGSGSRI